MWLFTPFGFFSVVQKPADEAEGMLTVRSRVRTDLDALRAHYLPGLGAVSENSGSDYRFRARVSKDALALAAADIVRDIGYGNFKNEVAKRQGKARAAAYGEVWNVLYDLQSDPAVTTNPMTASASPKTVSKASGKATAWGGVLVDDQGRVLLRRPKGHYDGYVWTFPKGRPDPGETPQQTALREVREETGYEARIVTAIDGEFAGGTTVTRFFLMTSVADHQDFDRAETTEVRWVALDEAEAMIAQTTNATGRKRDLGVLAVLRSRG